jgi:mRNA interferase MazF
MLRSSIDEGQNSAFPFPFTDLTTKKLRPALVLYAGKSDVVVAFISSNIPSKSSRTDIVIERKNKEFPATGLRISSVIKLDKVATILKELIVGEIGYVGTELRKEINSKIAEAYEI